MADLSVDGLDLFALPVFIAGSLASLGWLSLTVPLTDLSLSSTLWSTTADGYTTQISLGIILSSVALAYVLWTNDLGWRGWSGLQIWVVAVTFWLILSPPFVPIMDMLLAGSEFAKLAAFTLQTIGFSTVSYLG